MSEFPVRRYDEQEVRWLLERVGELQRTSTVPGTAGLTLAELEAIASEAGLDPALMRRAARDLAASKPLRSGGILGAPLSIAIERTLPFEISEAAFGRLLTTIEAAGGPGQANQIGQTFSWQSRRAESGRSMQLRVSVADGATTISVEENFGSLAGGLFGGVLGGVGGGFGIAGGTAIGIALHSVALALGLPALVIGTTFLSLRAGFKRYVRKRYSILQRLLDDLESGLRDARTGRQIADGSRTARSESDLPGL
jgi:hypothetical protein